MSLNVPFQVLDFPFFEDERGQTVPIEFDDTFPFVPKRTYFVTGNGQMIRGGHAHLVEAEVFAVTSGTVTAVLHDGENEMEIVLDAKNKGLFVDKMVWHEFKDFSEDAVMVCFSSTHYMPGEINYIMDKQEFLTQKQDG